MDVTALRHTEVVYHSAARDPSGFGRARRATSAARLRATKQRRQTRLMLQHVDHIDATPEIIDLREQEKWGLRAR